MGFGDVDVGVAGAVAVLFGLTCFGWGYNRWVGQLEMEGLQRGFVSFLVAVGVAVTGVGYAWIVGSFAHGVLLFLCFLASGGPMMAGSVRRYVLGRAKEEADSRHLVEKRLGDG